MPKPTKAQMLQMAKTSQPRSASIRPSVVVEEKSSVQLRIPPTAVPTASAQPRPQKQTEKRPLTIELGFDLKAALTKIANEIRAHALGYTITFGAGVGVGLFVLGWYLFPVQITQAPFSLLIESDKQAIVHTAADLAAYDPNNKNLLRLANAWPEMDDQACLMVAYEQDINESIRLQSLAARMNGVGCP